MHLEVFHRKKSQPLAEDYKEIFDKVKGRFDYSPWDAEELYRRTEWLDGSESLRADRSELAQVLSQYNEKIGNDSAALESAAKLGEPGVLTVVGGQQAGLFTGPLLVLYKAVTIIRAAKEASEKLGRTVIPVFWIAGEDHDFDEVNHIHWLSSEPSIRKWKLEQPSGVRTSISRLRFEDWQEAVTALDESLTPSDFKPELMDRIKEWGEKSGALTDYFARIMAFLFGRHGLVLVDSDDPQLRRLESSMFGRILEHNDVLRDAYLTGKAGVEVMGYTPSAEVSPSGVNLFYFNDAGERLLLQQEGEYITDRKHTLSFTKDELLQQSRSEPERFSNNVLTRPLMQDYVFPVLYTVLGPGEIAYWALTREAFHSIGFKMPIIMPRLEFTLLEGTIQKNMEKFALTFEDAADRYEEKKEEWLAEQDQLGLNQMFDEVKNRFDDLYAPLLKTVGGINPGLVKMGETNRVKIMEQIDFLRNKAVEAHESKFSSGTRQLERIRLSLAPMSKPQERVYNMFAYWNRYGGDWLEQLISLPLELDGEHRLVYL